MVLKKENDVIYMNGFNILSSGKTDSPTQFSLPFDISGFSCRLGVLLERCPKMTGWSGCGAWVLFCSRSRLPRRCDPAGLWHKLIFLLPGTPELTCLLFLPHFLLPIVLLNFILFFVCDSQCFSAVIHSQRWMPTLPIYCRAEIEKVLEVPATTKS